MACVPPPLPSSPPSLPPTAFLGDAQPVLPVLPFDDLDDAIALAKRACEQPLALYVFSERRAAQERLLEALPSGGACINSTVEHYLCPDLPFGGVGESGMGAYHGKHGFDEFSHKRGIMYRTTLLNIFSIPYFPAGASSAFYAIASKAQLDGLLTRSSLLTSRLLKLSAFLLFYGAVLLCGAQPTVLAWCSGAWEAATPPGQHIASIPAEANFTGVALTSAFAALVWITVAW